MVMDALLISPRFCSFLSYPQTSKSKSKPSNHSNSNALSVSLLNFKKAPVSLRNPSNSNYGCDQDSSFPLKFNPLLGLFRSMKLLASCRWDGGGRVYLHNGGIGMALLSVTTTAKVRISPFMAQLAANPTFVSGLVAWITAQSIKMLLNFFVERKWDFRILFASGGMPSSHSALCTALTTSVALCHGVADSLFPVCLGFSLIVMYDAIGVRRHAGMQAQVLNMIVEDLFQGHPISQRKLKELLGHTPSQVLAGALLGIIVACICCQGCFVAT